jgi:NAD+ synthetase
MALAKALGITCHNVPIAPPFAAFQKALPELLEPAGLPRENIQARIRGNILMAHSNAQRALLLTTGNKSEVAVGYCTLYGDMAGGLAVIADVFKTDVYRICRRMNERAGRELIPESTLTKPPSAELAPDQKDTDSLPPYEVLDPILLLYVDERSSRASIIAKGYDAAVVNRVCAMVDRNEFKRRQSPPTLRVSSKAFGIGRRMPIAATLTSFGD